MWKNTVELDRTQMAIKYEACALIIIIIIIIIIIYLVFQRSTKVAIELVNT
jgi:hypothetical protein